MTIEAIWKRILEHQFTGVQWHAQMTNYFDFLDLHGYKREQEYHYFDESIALRKTHRYVINHHNILIDMDYVLPSDIIPKSWYSHEREDVDAQTKRRAISDAFDKWYHWEKNTKELYSQLYVECIQNGYIADANKINCLIDDVDQELKYLCRQHIRLKTIDYDLIYIESNQDSLHEYYKDKIKSLELGKF